MPASLRDQPEILCVWLYTQHLSANQSALISLPCILQCYQSFLMDGKDSESPILTSASKASHTTSTTLRDLRMLSMQDADLPDMMAYSVLLLPQMSQQSP